MSQQPERDLISRMRRVPAALFALALLAPLSMGVRQCEPVRIPEGCDYDGDHYAAFDKFKSNDGCNDCTCEADGSVTCTERACQPQVCGGIAGAACPDKQYCSFPPEAQCGAADQTGTCEAQPELCNEIYKPVCGCDDKTYANACQAAAAGVSVRKDGACEPVGSGQTCGGLQGAGCADGEYCDFAPEAQCGAADQTGTCEVQPEVCTKIYRPVCGCDDKTYANACEAAAAGVSVRKSAECDAPSGGCDYDGKHYDVGAGFPSSDGCNSCSCSADGQVVCTLRACVATCGGLTGLQCKDGQYCSYRPEDHCGAADATGICADKPQVCTEESDPVCGCDGKTYGNPCMAASAGVAISAEGECK